MFYRNQLRKFIGVLPEIKDNYGYEICSFFVGGTNMISKVAPNELMAHCMGIHTEFNAICTNFGEGSVKLQDEYSY